MKTPTSSRFPVLDNKPIDQWKVTELKEELKRRKLTTSGLKNDLVRRLDEALRAEMDTVPENEDNVGKGNENGEPESALPNAGFPGVGEDTIDNAGMSVEGNVGDVGVNVVSMGEGKSEEQQSGLVSDTAAPGEDLEIDFGGQSVGLVSDPAAPEVGVETTIDEAGEGLVSDPAAPEVGVETIIDRPCEGLVSNSAAPEVGGLSGTDVTSALQGGNVSEGLSIDNAVGTDGLLVDSTEKENEDSKAQQHPEDILPSNEDVKPDSSVPISQVSEVSSSLGFTVKSNNSISTDSVSIIEKNDLKDNIIADNVKLESDLKPEMVQPPSNDLVTVGGQLHPTDVDEPHENKVSVEETDSTLANADMSQKNYSAYLGSPEKLNLDRSSGDDSMEEDALESKQIDSNYNPEVGEKNEQIEITANKEEIPVETMDTDIPVEVKDLRDEKNSAVVTSSDKRKLSDQEAVVNNKPAKRQHRWKTDSNNVSDPHVSIVSPSPPASDVPQFAVAKRNFSRSDSKGANDPPKEREVPPSAKPATNSLRIDNFLRPFTLKAVQELLGKTGNVTSFWMDHIKTHCYITYSSVEEATETRNAVYNLQWPPNGGRQLVAEFVDVEEVKLRLEPPPAAPVTPVPATPVTPVPAKAPEPATIPQPSPRQRLGQRMTEQRELPPPPPMLNRAPPPPLPQIEKVEAPLVTLDDLFRKTKATPRIYYLPLTEEQVAARRKSSEQ